MSNLPSVKELHDRAAEAATETRSTMIKLSTGSLGLLIFIATREIDPAISSGEKIFLILTIAFVVASLASAIWFGFSEAQWAYWWGVEIDQEHKERSKGYENKLAWHKRKAWGEKGMLVFFVLAAVTMGIFILLRVLTLDA